MTVPFEPAGKQSCLRPTGPESLEEETSDGARSVGRSGADRRGVVRTVAVYILIGLNTAVNWWLARDTRAERLLEGTATTIIQDGSLDERALRRLSLHTSEIQHAVLLQNGDSISDVARGQLEPDGQLLISLKDTEQGATRGDIQALQASLDTIEQLLRHLTAPRTT
ncbi:YetF domain-containing protein [Streptomyces polygonati]|uniref:YetF domain-containing protein n=1 Tax=Streptomyces polygonati TaxID=1617087 RepID=A0ABV8HR99_9ACTN